MSVLDHSLTIFGLEWLEAACKASIPRYADITVQLIVIFSVFLYSMPGYKCPIKERMLYSSCKATLIEVLEGQMALEIIRKVNHLNRKTILFILDLHLFSTKDL